MLLLFSSFCVLALVILLFVFSFEIFPFCSVHLFVPSPSFSQSVLFHNQSPLLSLLAPPTPTCLLLSFYPGVSTLLLSSSLFILWFDSHPAIHRCASCQVPLCSIEIYLLLCISAATIAFCFYFLLILLNFVLFCFVRVACVSHNSWVCGLQTETFINVCR